MAIVKFGVTVVGARGTIGGAKFSANASGPYVSQWSRSANPRTALQQDQRGRIGEQAVAWRNLSDAQRLDWDDYADDPPQERTNSLGETFFASGFNWFCKINQNLLTAGEATRVDAPTLTRSAAPQIRGNTTLRITGGAGVSRVEVTVSSPNPTFNHVLFTMLTRHGRTVFPPKKPFTVLDVPDVGLRIFPQAELEAVFGTISLDQRAFYQLQIQDSHGQRSPVDTFRVDATA